MGDGEKNNGRTVTLIFRLCFPDRRQHVRVYFIYGFFLRIVHGPFTAVHACCCVGVQNRKHYRMHSNARPNFHRKGQNGEIIATRFPCAWENNIHYVPGLKPPSRTKGKRAQCIRKECPFACRKYFRSLKRLGELAKFSILQNINENSNTFIKPYTHGT